MPQTINNNIISLNAQRSVNTSQTALASLMQRLSSGLRVNSAKDDAAGLAIAERMTAQVRANRQAQPAQILQQAGKAMLAQATQLPTQVLQLLR